MANSSKNIQKTTYSNGNTQKETILFHIFLSEYTLFLTPLLFSRGEMKIQKNWVRGGIIFLKNHQGKEWGKRENTKFVEVTGFFHFHFLTISRHGN